MKLNQKNYLFCPISTIDYPTIISFLNKQVEKGWLLTKYYPSLNLMQFTPTKSTDIHYGVEIKEIDGPRAAYNSVHFLSYYRSQEEKGWTSILSHHNIHLFYTNDLSQGEPLTTQQCSTQQELNNSLFKNMAITVTLSTLLLVALLAAQGFLVNVPNHNFSWLASDNPLIQLTTMTALLVMTDSLYQVYRCLENNHYLKQNISLLEINHRWLLWIPTIVRLLFYVGLLLIFLSMINGQELIRYIDSLFIYMSVLIINVPWRYYEKHNGNTHTENKENLLFTFLIQFVLLFSLLFLFRLLFDFVYFQ